MTNGQVIYNLIAMQDFFETLKNTAEKWSAEAANMYDEYIKALDIAISELEEEDDRK